MSGLGWLVILGEIAMVLGLALALVVPPHTSGWSHRPLRAIRRRTRRCGHERGRSMSPATGRWRVIRWGSLPGFPPLWLAISPWVNDNIGCLFAPFPTWREAMDYADRKARR